MNWQNGDMALCIKQGDWFIFLGSNLIIKSYGPKAGKVLTVSSVTLSKEGEMGLTFDEYPNNIYSPIRFVKITPNKELEEEFDRINKTKTSPNNPGIPKIKELAQN